MIIDQHRHHANTMAPNGVDSVIHLNGNIMQQQQPQHHQHHQPSASTGLQQQEQLQPGQQQPHSNLDELVSLLRNEIFEGRQTLLDTQSNLEKVADYCTSSYLESPDKKSAFDKTKNYTTHSLASVAYQVNTLAYNILHMLDLQANQISEMESQLNFITQKVDFHREKVARREIALLTSAKTSARQPKVLAPANKEKQGKYSRKPIDYTLLDDVGHGVKAPTSNQSHLFRTNSSNSGSLVGASSSGRLSGIQTLGPKSSMAALQQHAAAAGHHYHHYNTLGGGSGPPPTTKPPTPPQMVRSGYGTLSRSSASSKEYRALAPPIAPPQVPKNYEPNYPIGHPKNPITAAQQGRGANYGTLPAHASAQQYGYGVGGGGGSITGNNSHYGYNGGMSGSSIGSAVSVHSAGGGGGQYGGGVSTQLPPPPPPDALPDPPPPPSHQQQQQQHSHLHQQQPQHIYDSRNNTASPPLPPPPPPVDEHQQQQTTVIYGTTVARQNSLPDWVPSNYIEKVIAIYDYAANKDDELTFQENSVIYVTRKNDDGWFEGVMNGVTGLFPGNYVEPCL